jgi:hypothetical protein
MPTNDEKREAIMIELNKRAIAEGTTERYFAILTPAIATAYLDAKGDAVKLMGLAQALLRHATTVFYASATTPADLQVRVAEDVAKMAGVVWDETCRHTEQLVAALLQKGADVPQEMINRVNAMPSDPSKRPDVAPVDSSAGAAGRPRSVADLLSKLNEPEPEPEPQVQTTEEPKPEEPKEASAPKVRIKPPEYVAWSGGSTMQELSKVGNGKGN